MGKIVISENITLDGVIEVPDGEGAWFTRVSDADRAAWAKVEFEEALAAEALLMGRHSYEWFVQRGWTSRTGEWADRLRGLPKYVVSSEALDGPDWGTSTTLAIDEVPALKRRLAGDIVVYGSGRLATALLERNLVDELRLMTYPIIVGTGARLFGATSAKEPLSLADVRRVGDGLALLTYTTS